MNTTYPTILAAKVAGRNKLNTAIRDLMPIILASCQSFIGNKIRITNGWERKFKQEIKGIEDLAKEHGVDLYFRESYDSLIANFRTTTLVNKEERGDRAVYTESQIYFGTTLGKNLAHLNKFNVETWRTDYTELEICTIRHKVKELDKELSAEKSKLLYFGEYDN